MIESSFQDGNTAAGGAGRGGVSTLRAWEPAPAGWWQEPSRRDGRIQLAMELKAAQAMSGQGWRGTGSSAEAGRPHAGTARAAARAAVSIPWISAQHKPACLCRIPRPHLGFLAGLAPSHLPARPCRTVPACARREAGTLYGSIDRISPSRRGQQQANGAVQRERELYRLLNTYYLSTVKPL